MHACSTFATPKPNVYVIRIEPENRLDIIYNDSSLYFSFKRVTYKNDA